MAIDLVKGSTMSPTTRPTTRGSLSLGIVCVRTYSAWDIGRASYLLVLQMATRGVFISWKLVAAGIMGMRYSTKACLVSAFDIVLNLEESAVRCLLYSFLCPSEEYQSIFLLPRSISAFNSISLWFTGKS